MISLYLREDEDFQNYNLIENMKYYDMPEDMIQRAEQIMADRREKLKKDRAMLIYLIEDQKEIE